MSVLEFRKSKQLSEMKLLNRFDAYELNDKRRTIFKEKLTRHDKSFRNKDIVYDIDKILNMNNTIVKKKDPHQINKKNSSIIGRTKPLSSPKMTINKEPKSLSEIKTLNHNDPYYNNLKESRKFGYSTRMMNIRNNLNKRSNEENMVFLKIN